MPVKGKDFPSNLRMTYQSAPEDCTGCGLCVHACPAKDKTNPKHKVVAVDYGAKRNILRCLASAGCDVTVLPATATASEVLAHQPDGVFLSNGPGDPEPVKYGIQTAKTLLGYRPIFGICLGHQILGLALGGKSYKLKFGHRGANHPVKNLLTGQVEITSQNHGFAIDPQTLDPEKIEITHINLNDNSCEGMQHRKHPAFSVQYHPEHAPGPHDARYLFDRFIDLITEHKSNA